MDEQEQEKIEQTIKETFEQAPKQEFNQESNQNYRQENEFSNNREDYDDKNNLAAGLLAIFLGPLGIHKFYLGYTKEGITMLLISLLTLGIGAAVMNVISLIEGILYLTYSKEEFYRIYVKGHKGWF